METEQPTIVGNNVILWTYRQMVQDGDLVGIPELLDLSDDWDIDWEDADLGWISAKNEVALAKLEAELGEEAFEDLCDDAFTQEFGAYDEEDEQQNYVRSLHLRIDIPKEDTAALFGRISQVCKMAQQMGLLSVDTPVSASSDSHTERIHGNP